MEYTIWLKCNVYIWREKVDAISIGIFFQSEIARVYPKCHKSYFFGKKMTSGNSEVVFLVGIRITMIGSFKPLKWKHCLKEFDVFYFTFQRHLQNLHDSSGFCDLSCALCKK